MKHPHASIIKQWLEDTTQEIELLTMSHNSESWVKCNINDVLTGNLLMPGLFRLKQKQDEYEHLLL